MRKDIYLFCQFNGTMTSFKRSFESSSAPPSIGTIIALGTEGEPKGILKKGVVTDVRVIEDSVQIKVGTVDASTEGLRDCLAKTEWKEVPLPVW